MVVYAASNGGGRRRDVEVFLGVAVEGEACTSSRGARGIEGEG